MYNVLRITFIFLALLRGAIGSEPAPDNGDPGSASRPTPAPVSSTSANTYISVVRTTDISGTCPSRTVNYITHTLAQQCLRTDRVPHVASHSLDANATPSMTRDATPAAPQASQAGTQSATAQPSLSTPLTAIANATENAPPSTDAVPAPSSHHRSIEATPIPLSDEDNDSPLDNANFLSFDEWKRQNLAKVGQVPEDVGRAQQAEPHRPRPINNALESMGEEHEIDLDFSGFGGPQPAPEQPSAKADHELAQSVGLPPLRSKDAGKTCKERTNYASFDCAATVLKTNKECTHSSSILIEHKDSYMLNICSVKNKFFIVELCNDIQIDTIVLANYEFFSSNFRHFKASVSDRYPVKEEKWRVLGTFEARNTRELQAFLVENPLIWAKYLRIELLTHYGTEYYCPVSLLRVHGTTMMEDYRHQEELARGEVEETEIEALETEVPATLPIAQEPIESTDEASKATVQAIPPIDGEQPPPKDSPPPSQEQGTMPSEQANIGDSAASPTPTISVYRNGSMSMQVRVYEPTNQQMTCDTPTTSEDGTSTPAAASHTDEQAAMNSADRPASSVNSDHSKGATSTNVAGSNNATLIGSPFSRTLTNHTTKPTSIGSQNVTEASASSTNSTNQTVAATDSTRVASTAASPPPPQPSTQESFFKSVTKRLLQLENNSTLSLQYIEEQSRILRDAFSKVEKRQVGKTAKFLATLNETVMVELHGFRQAYDQLWQSTVIELENQREVYQREMLAMSTRLTMVADELVWQKRMGIVQSTLLLLCLALVLFGRQGNGVLDVPIMQHMMNRSRDALRGGWESQSPPNSPTSPDSRSPVSLFRRKIWKSTTTTPEHQREKFLSDSDLSRQQTREREDGGILTPSSSQERAHVQAPEVNVQPPSPPQPGTDDWEDFSDRGGSASPECERKGGPSSPGRKRKKARHKASTSGGFGTFRPKSSPLGLNFMS
ncbi:uncharacterized protein MYCFIDRAFT_215681 [Pseudocercospora fijiensis CIRAD86]|uniref:SUN-like protein 1 n=1 Tax=Pseudocercospora fijiensis (strain CIRAD86) TaxID=383855 RepID=M3AZ18_PSEFD|nr:uncharacterized protein MYCFIDRAFT_215681 [Pseudocercospora fijiensis CIRAD86]EME82428.1 hypothetical protein MYCFIDRAFT_215681 [Pseudocercospora fijiensis CIRAD86]